MYLLVAFFFAEVCLESEVEDIYIPGQISGGLPVSSSIDLP